MSDEGAPAGGFTGTRPLSPRRARANTVRCAVCRLHQTLCLCTLVPRLETRTRLVLVLHQSEAGKTSNTGQLAVRCLPNSEVVFRGGEPLSDESAYPWTSAAAPVLLYPDADAQPIERWRDHPSPITLIVPDGTWTQAKRARSRLPGLARVPCALLPPDGASRYRLRHSDDPTRLCTMEAIARALEVLDGPRVRVALEQIFDVMVERTLWAQGRLASTEVTGGIPDAARVRDPRSGPRNG